MQATELRPRPLSKLTYVINIAMTRVGSQRHKKKLLYLKVWNKWHERKNIIFMNINHLNVI
jgi:hypothetical protein